MSRPSRRSASRKSDPNSKNPPKKGAARPARSRTKGGTASERAAAESAATESDDDLEELPTLEPIEEGGDEDLPTLEPIEGDEELPTLEPLEEDLATVNLEIPDETLEYDVRLDVRLIDVETPKAKVPAAIEGPLMVAAQTHAAALRWRRVAVHFIGDAMIPSAAKECIAKALGKSRPLSVIVQRGYGDELVLENTMPSLTINWSTEGEELTAKVSAAEVDTNDIETLLPVELGKRDKEMKDQRVVVSFDGGVEVLTRGVRDSLRSLGSAVSAKSLGVRTSEGEVILFDRVLEEQVRIGNGSDGYDVDFRVRTTGDADLFEAALDLALQHATPLAGKRIAVRAAGCNVTAAERSILLNRVARQKPKGIDLFDSGGVSRIFPPLLAAAATKSETTIKVVPGERDEKGIKEAFDRELDRMAQAIEKRNVVVDWPEGFPVTDALQEIAISSLSRRKASRITFTFGGEHREPMAPPPLQLKSQGDLQVLEIDTDAGKPPELIRAIDRHLRTAGGKLSGKPVEVRVQGSGAMSRSMQRSLRDQTAQAGAIRCVLVEQGNATYLFPTLLSLSEQDGSVKVAVDLAGRDRSQVEQSLADELKDVDLGGKDVTLSPTEHDLVICRALVEKGAASVTLGGKNPRRLHPALLTASSDGETLVLSVTPGSDESADLGSLGEALADNLAASNAPSGALAETDIRVEWPEAVSVYDRASQPKLLSELVTMVLAKGPRSISLQGGSAHALPVYPRGQGGGIKLLGRREGSEPELSLIGLPAKADENLASLGYELMTEAPHYDGHRVLITWPVSASSDDDQAPEERSIERDSTIAQIIDHVLGARTAAVLLRQNDESKHWFEVVSSNHEALPKGLRVKDPRPAKEPEVPADDGVSETDSDPLDVTGAALTGAGTAAMAGEAFSDDETKHGIGEDAPGSSDAGSGDDTGR